MGITIICSAFTLFIGYQLGWVNGYDKKGEDDRRIEAEMEVFWKGEKKTWAMK